MTRGEKASSDTQKKVRMNSDVRDERDKWPDNNEKAEIRSSMYSNGN